MRKIIIICLAAFANPSALLAGGIAVDFDISGEPGNILVLQGYGEYHDKIAVTAPKQIQHDASVSDRPLFVLNGGEKRNELPLILSQGDYDTVNSPELHGKIISILREYNDIGSRQPALASMLKEDPVIGLRGRTVYLLAENRIVCVTGKDLSSQVGNSESKNIPAILDGFVVAYEVINAVFEAADNVIPAAIENYNAHQYNDPNAVSDGGSGATYHSGQGGGSNYDVNKKVR